MERALPDRKFPTEILRNLLQMKNAPSLGEIRTEKFIASKFNLTESIENF